MKKHFITGLALLLPAILTALIFLFLVNLLTKPFMGIVADIFNHYGLADKQSIKIFSRLIVLAALIIVVFFIGVLGRIFIFRYFLKIGHKLVDKIPFINKIYRAIYEVITTIFQTETPTFSQVVLVPFPKANNLCIGLITNDPQTLQLPEDIHGNISVFIPATPNPTMGFMLLFKRDQLIFLDMKVDEALRFIVSCGVMAPTFQVIKDDNNRT